MRPGVSLPIAVLLLAGAARANEDGRQTDRSMRGCGTATTCHGTNPGATAQIEGPMRLDPGATATYTLVLRSTRSDFMAGGFNISAAGATIARNGNAAQQRGAELTHAQPVSRSGDAVRVPFDLTAPMTAGAAMIFAAGNTVNGLSTSSNDAWAITSLAVVIGDADAGAVTDAGATADTGPRTERYDPTASSAYGTCSATPGAARGGWSAMLLLGLAFARRRRSCSAD